MKIAEFSVRNSMLMNLISALILIVGTISMFTLHREAFPVIDFDEVSVQTTYAGAPAEDVEKLVTTPLEKELREVDDIDEMRSISRDGFSIISLKMNPDGDENARRKIVNDIQKAVDRVIDLPAAVEDRPLVLEINSKIFPVINIGIGGQADEFKLQEIADDLKGKLENINGVAKVTRLGYRNQEFWVEPDVNKLHNMHVSIDEIMQALKARNVTVPAGKLNTPDEEFAIKTTGEFKTAEEIGEVIIRANDTGNWLKVSDVAQVKNTFEEQTVINKNRGKPAITLEVYKKEKGDAIYVVEDTYKVLENFRQTLPKGTEISTFDDMSYYIKRRLNVLRSNGFIGFVFVVLILFAFLHSRPAFFTAMGIPVAMAATLMVMLGTGLTINLLTMFGLIIVIGMIVDDGIIISENVYRYVEQGLSPEQAAIKGTSEVIAPVAATIITTIAAFFPLMYMGGILGKFLRYIPMMVIVALCASVLEAFFILPSHLADFLKPIKTESEEKKQTNRDFYTMLWITVISALLAGWMSIATHSDAVSTMLMIIAVGGASMIVKKYPILDKLTNFYKQVLEKALNARYLVVAFSIAALIIAFAVIIFVLPKEMFNGKGVEEMLIRAEAKVGTPLEKTNELMSPVEAMVNSMPKNYVQSYVTTIGSIESGRGMGDPNAQSGSNVAQVHIYLTPLQQRDKGPKEIMEELRPQLDKIKGFEKLYFYELKDGPPVGRDVEFNIKGDDLNILNKLAKELKAYMKTFPGVSDISDSYTLGDRELRIVVDRDQAAVAGLSVGSIAASLRNTFEGGWATSIKRTKAEEEIKVRVRVPEQQRTSMAIFDKLLIANSRGDLIPLNKVAKIEESQGLRTISHLDGTRYIQVATSVDQKKIKSSILAAKITERFNSLAKQYSGYSLDLSGEEKENKDSFRDLMVAFLIAVLAIFMILAALFKSLVQPFIVMMAIPYSMIGVVIALLLHHESLGLLAFIGIVGLSGVVVNDSIVLVDFINKLRSEGSARRESIINSGVLRLRPVMLTTLTTVAGLSTVAYGIGGFDPFLQPMALSIAWGLAFSTVLTLVVMPCLYAIIDDWKIRILYHPALKKLNKNKNIK